MIGTKSYHRITKAVATDRVLNMHVVVKPRGDSRINVRGMVVGKKIMLRLRIEINLDF